MADIEIEIGKEGKDKDKKSRGFMSALMDYLKNKGKGSKRPAFSFGSTGKSGDEAWDALASAED